MIEIGIILFGLISFFLGYKVGNYFKIIEACRYCISILYMLNKDKTEADNLKRIMYYIVCTLSPSIYTSAKENLEKTHHLLSKE